MLFIVIVLLLLYLYYCLIFFFKQKTAYEMRISDWSSDVCSSDLTFRAAFAGFDPDKVARFDGADVERLMGDPGIIRARAKIEATIGGARIFRDMRERGEDFSAYAWDFVGGEPIRNDEIGRAHV